jgi:ribosomal protein L11 methyltransferase
LKTWIEVKAKFSRAPQDPSPFIEAFARYGCESTIQTDAPATLSGYFEELTGTRGHISGLEAELTALGAADVESNLVQDEDWSSMWRVHFKTRRVGPRVVIQPTWEDYSPREEDIILLLDPGQAFGTGDHPTTRLCLELLQEIPLAGKSVAEVGCGSGVLSIAALKLGAASVLATDIDPQSVEIARENAALNNTAIECRQAAGFEGLTGEFDMVLSNIISATLIRIAPDAARRVAPGGYWIVSGIIEQNWSDVEGAAEDAGFKLQTERHEDGWVGAIFLR